MTNERPYPEKRRSDRRTGDRRKGDRRKGDRRVMRRGRRKEDRGGIGTLLFLCIAALLALVAFITFETGIGTDINWRKMFFQKDREKQTFTLEGVSLGMSPEAVRKQHPNLDLVGLGRGETVATFNIESAHYTVWFIKIDGNDKAYRMRYDQSFRTRTEAEILESIGVKHGKPGTSECAKAGDEARKCHFQWWPSGGIALSVSTAEVKSASKLVRTDVTMLATDTYLDGKRMRIKSKPNVKKPTTVQKNSLEKLPF